LTDYLIVPKAWALWASGCKNPSEACALLARTERRATVVTDAADGCYFISGTDAAVRHYPAFKVDVFDTNGCGDTFHGAFALAVAREVAVQDAIIFATAAAALKAKAAGGERRGWDALPSFTEVAHFLQQSLKEPERSSVLPRLLLLRNVVCDE
jgi:sugar/nucleoside kinase (ribokinase family)